MSRYKIDRIPHPPVIAKPKREDYDSNAAWGIALDGWEVAVENRKKEVNEIDEKNRELFNKMYEQFKRDLKVEHSWGWMTEKQFSAVVSHLYDRGHHAGLDEMFSMSYEVAELLGAFKP